VPLLLRCAGRRCVVPGLCLLGFWPYRRRSARAARLRRGGASRVQRGAFFGDEDEEDMVVLQIRPKKKRQKQRSKGADKALRVPVHPPEDVFSLDVECIAVGQTHEKADREPCSLALVDGFGKTVLRQLIRPEKPIVSYLTPFTGLQAGDLDGGRAIGRNRAISELKAKLPSRAILVGQDPQGDVDWMELVAGADFKATVNLADVLKNSKGMKFSLRHEALVLLGEEPQGNMHDPAWDATVSVKLYQKAAQASPKELEKMREKLTSKKFWPPKPSLARLCGYKLDGVCLSAYGSEHCICGRPLLTGGPTAGA